MRKLSCSWAFGLLRDECFEFWMLVLDKIIDEVRFDFYEFLYWLPSYVYFLEVFVGFYLFFSCCLILIYLSCNDISSLLFIKCDPESTLMCFSEMVWIPKSHFLAKPTIILNLYIYFLSRSQAFSYFEISSSWRLRISALLFDYSNNFRYD